MLPITNNRWDCSLGCWAARCWVCCGPWGALPGMPARSWMCSRDQNLAITLWAFFGILTYPAPESSLHFFDQLGGGLCGVVVTFSCTLVALKVLDLHFSAFYLWTTFFTRSFWCSINSVMMVLTVFLSQEAPSKCPNLRTSANPYICS